MCPCFSPSLTRAHGWWPCTSAGDLGPDAHVIFTSFRTHALFFVHALLPMAFAGAWRTTVYWHVGQCFDPTQPQVSTKPATKVGESGQWTC
jgi:hypothetical protein